MRGTHSPRRCTTGAAVSLRNHNVMAHTGFGVPTRACVVRRTREPFVVTVSQVQKGGQP